MQPFYGFYVITLLPASVCTDATVVEPPTNVTLHCHNMQAFVKWTYGQYSPELRFKVVVYSYNDPPVERWVDPPHLEAELSFLGVSDNDYFLQVIAEIGQNKSKPVPEHGITFSYFKDSPAQQKCSLDLPEVNVTAQPDAIISFRFLHPWLEYQHKLPIIKKLKHRSRTTYDKPPPEFKYDVVINNQAPHEFTCEKKVCEESLPVNATLAEHCLTITGELKHMTVETSKPYCTLSFTEPIPPNTVLYVVPCVAAFIAAAGFVAVMLYRKNTRPSTSLPDTIKITSKAQKSNTLGTERVLISVPEVEPTTPTPLLSTETEEFSSAFTSSTDGDLRLPVRVIVEDEDVCNRMEEGQPNNESSAYMEGLGLEEDDLANSNGASSGYEKREALSVALGPDDRAEGYRG
ncbi:interferon gamma receptor 1-like isoform X3 [Channa argus]|uniref:interferon gamma receptor 1-like isoform X3 n=1 Tax=Channa argus TaxID=215402 RepID=UPI003522EC59